MDTAEPASLCVLEYACVRAKECLHTRISFSVSAFLCVLVAARAAAFTHLR